MVKFFIEELFEQFVGLIFVEFNDFVKVFEEKFEVIVVVFVVVVGVVGGVGVVEVEEEKDFFDVIFEVVGDKKIQVIKIVCEFILLGFGEVKVVVDGVFKVVFEGVNKEIVEKVKVVFEEVGVMVIFK